MSVRRNSAKILLSSGARCLAKFSSHNLLLRRIAVILFGLDKSAGGLKEEVIDHLGISSYCCRLKNLLVIVIDTTLDVLDVDGHNPYETFVVTTCI